MGGTSTDVALIAGGVPEVSTELTIDYGLPIHVPMVDVRSVGAGGGSIARLNAAGVLAIGPQSAGSSPGPICYGRGGERPTITDANLLLGRLDPERLTGAAGTAPVEAVRRAIAEEIGKPLGLSHEEAAAAIIRLAATHMAGAIRMVSLSRGHDPRDFVLFAFGGAGPLHAVAIARELGVPEVLAPARPGLTNALGCLVADLRQDFVRTVNQPLDMLDMDTLTEIFAAQRSEGERINSAERDEIVETAALYGADMQFRGQTHLIRVAIPSPTISRAELQALFEEAYFARFQVRLPEISAVVVNLTTAVIGRRRSLSVGVLAAGFSSAQRGMGTATQLGRSRVARFNEPKSGTPDFGGGGGGKCMARRSTIRPLHHASHGPPPPSQATGEKPGSRPVYADGAWHDAIVVDRECLQAGDRIDGPAVIHQLDATTFVPPRAAARVDEIGNLRIRTSSEI
jgi:N-methylhydantoinase A